MDTSYVTAFIDATQIVFDTMLSMPITFGRPEVAESLPTKFDISGIIGLSGDVVGAVVLSFPKETAEGVVTAFAGAPLSANSDDFADAIGELANMISGNAKAKFTGRSISISCPSVVIGKNHRIHTPSDSTCISIPCHSSCGEFAVEVCIREVESAVGSQSASETASAAG
ncbi:MAG: chemotaxis protein CheX [Planctomycetes bacterium]|nr:chemotaxis protein CheX [Planctomycetota bacterium]